MSKPAQSVPAICAALLVALAACAERPGIATRIDQTALAAPSPTLVPIGPLIAAANGLAAAPAAGPPPGRLAALAARAARLRGPVVPGPTRAQMDAATRRHAALRVR